MSEEKEDNSINNRNNGLPADAEVQTDTADRSLSADSSSCMKDSTESEADEDTSMSLMFFIGNVGVILLASGLSMLASWHIGRLFGQSWLQIIIYAVLAHVLMQCIEGSIDDWYAEKKGIALDEAIAELDHISACIYAVICCCLSHIR